MYRILRHCQCRCHLIVNRYVQTDSKPLTSRNNPWLNVEQNTHKVRVKFEGSGSHSNARFMNISTGQLARFADGCAVAEFGDTSVMVTAVGKVKPPPVSFLPLTVDFRQKAAAAGRIPTNHLRRELGPSDREILTSRMIDRSIRPLFPEGFNYDTQISCNVLAADSENDPDIVTINAASAALSVSDIPWNGPIGAVRVGYINKHAVINPTRKELADSELNLIVAAADNNKLVMLDGSSDGIPYADFNTLIEHGIDAAQVVIKKIKELQEKCGVVKRPVAEIQELDKEIAETVESFAREKIKQICNDFTHHKFSRDQAIQQVKVDTVKLVQEKHKALVTEPVIGLVSNTVFEITKSVIRDQIMNSYIRVDGRNVNKLRPIVCDVDLFDPLHGSALFQRGQTQVLCTVTFDAPESAVKIDTVSALMSGIKEKNFFLHYEFPPYATNEIGRGFLGRRELGHGALAEKGLRAVIPKDYPFTIRLTSEVLESNGSSSMATVCGGSLALMDAGVPIQEAVAGVAMGAITVADPETNDITNYKVLVDLLGMEDYYGDMDFKLAGSKDCMTAIQADIKIPGMPIDIISDAIRYGREAIKKILKLMAKVQKEPRTEKKENHPVTENITVPITKKSKFLGYGGSNLKKITAQTGVTISTVDDSTYRVFAPNQVALNEAKETIEKLLAEDREPFLEFGSIHSAKIVELLSSGVMVQLYPSMAPTIVHNSQLDQRKVSHPSALGLEVGEEILVKYYGRDPHNGKIRLSRKAIQATASAKVMKSFPNNDNTA